MPGKGRSHIPGLNDAEKRGGLHKNEGENPLTRIKGGAHAFPEQLGRRKKIARRLCQEGEMEVGN